MTEPFYVAVKASLHASDSSVFGLTSEEIIALSKRYPDSNKEVINGVLIKASPLRVINSLCELGYRVVCSSGEAEIVWTLRREVLVENGKRIQATRIQNERSKSIDSYEKHQHVVPDKLKERGSISLEYSESEAEAIAHPSGKKTKGIEEKKPKLGTKPEDYAEYYDYKGSRIYVRNQSSLDDIDEDTKVIVNTNRESAGSPLLFETPTRQKHTENCSGMDHHSHAPVNPSVHQTLDELDFERGIWTPAMSGDISRLRELLKRGVSVDIEDNSGYTALHYAARNGHGHVCTTLLDAGASIDKATRAGGATPLHRAAMAGHADTCDVLLRYGANPVSKDIDGRTPLHRAVEQRHKDVIGLFLETMPATAFEKDNRGKSPLDYGNENEDLIKMFLNITNNS